MSPARCTAALLAALAILAAATPARPQSADGDVDSLPVIRCDPRSNTCSRPTGLDTLPAFGPSGEATVLSPSRRATEAGFERGEQRVSAPGCSTLTPGVELCNSIHEFQHCRTLMISSMVDSCRVEIAFARDDIEPRVAEAGTYSVEIESTARVRIERQSRGFATPRGRASVTLSLDLPAEADAPGWCLQRERYLYFATGPDGGEFEIEETDDCFEPIKFSYGAHADDIIRAWELCETFAAWGEELQDSIEILAAGIFTVRNSSPDFVARYPGGSAMIARTVKVQAPLAIDCRA